MADLGLAFDDDDLDTYRKKKSPGRNLPYHVKINTPRWFEDAARDSSYPDQEPQLLKFCAEYRYRIKDYGAAVEYFKAALAVLPENNTTLSQDMRESLARCYTHLTQYEEALGLARELVQEMSTEDEAHQRQALSLHAFVCERAGEMKECIRSLESLCLLQPSFAQTWYQLGDALAGHTQPELRGEHPDTDTSRAPTTGACREWIDSMTNGQPNVDQSEGAHEGGVETSLIVALTCYVRARLLFESVLGCASHLIKQRNLSRIQEITNKIDSLPLADVLKQSAREAVHKHVEKQRVDVEIETKPAQASNRPTDVSALFYNKFCSWYQP